jgi:hypothetical protein
MRTGGRYKSLRRRFHCRSVAPDEARIEISYFPFPTRNLARARYWDDPGIISRAALAAAIAHREPGKW